MAFFLPAFRITFENYQHTMRVFSLLLSSLFLVSLSNWGTDMENAKKQAEKEHKLIVLNFSGSDWCGPCIRLHKDIFDSDDFKALADKSLVLVNADFPRLKKNQLSKDQQKENDKLADKYNPQGSFPFTVLLDEKGNVLKSWDGYPGLSPAEFTTQVRGYVEARN